MALKYVQILLLACIFLLHYLVEHLYPQQKSINYWRNERFNILIGFLNIVLNLLPATLLIYWLELINEHNWGVLQNLRFPFPVRLVITIFSLDLWMYVWHRLNHNVSFLWKWHAFHHRDEKMNSTTAVRFHIVELLLSLPGKMIIYFLLGVEYNAAIIYEILFFISVVFHHSNIYVTENFDKVYRILFASPTMHRIHHSKRQEELHSNYSALFSFWDRIFKSFKSTAQQPIHFGVDQ